MMTTAVKRFGMSSSDFWDMPFFMFVSLLEVNMTSEDKKRNRKFVVDSQRHCKNAYGWN